MKSKLNFAMILAISLFGFLSFCAGMILDPERGLHPVFLGHWTEWSTSQQDYNKKYDNFFILSV